MRIHLLQIAGKEASNRSRSGLDTFSPRALRNAAHLQSRPVPVALEDFLLRTQGPDGGFHTGYDQAGTYNGTLENIETTSIIMITLSSITPSPAFPAWILITGIATLVAGVRRSLS